MFVYSCRFFTNSLILWSMNPNSDISFLQSLLRYLCGKFFTVGNIVMYCGELAVLVTDRAIELVMNLLLVCPGTVTSWLIVQMDCWGKRSVTELMPTFQYTYTVSQKQPDHVTFSNNSNKSDPLLKLFGINNSPFSLYVLFRKMW